MDIYLIRHTEPDVPRGVCYGQADIGVTASFLNEAAIIRQHLPREIKAVYSSPLQRCKMLATHLFPGTDISYHDHLMEINCGHWELKSWDEIKKDQLDMWMGDFINVRIPGGESYTDLYNRCSAVFDECATNELPAAIVAHGGVIRSILAHINKVDLETSFKTYSLHYGCVIKLTREQDSWQHEILSNIPHEKETHKPSGY